MTAPKHLFLNFSKKAKALMQIYKERGFGESVSFLLYTADWNLACQGNKKYQGGW